MGWRSKLRKSRTGSAGSLTKILHALDEHLAKTERENPTSATLNKKIFACKNKESASEDQAEKGESDSKHTGVVTFYSCCIEQRLSCRIHASSDRLKDPLCLTCAEAAIDGAMLDRVIEVIQVYLFAIKSIMFSSV